MRVHRVLVVAAVLVPYAASAQTTTADGIQALAHGDYATAARILRPLAEDASPPNPLALFFMASLYESGRGVAMNPIRACGLYLKAATPTNPLLTQSLALAQVIHRDIPFMRDLCSAASVGPWRDPPTASVTPGQDHPVVAASFAEAQAQRNAADGVAAFVRGDDQRAAEILKSLAEAWPSRDHAAEFLMATLYESGQGVPADPVRACALYMRASVDSVNPIGRQAAALMQSLRGSSSTEDFRRCVQLAEIGFDDAFQPVTFTLEQGDWITVDLDGATIAYAGTEKRTPLGLATGGVVFLPVEHTELTIDGTPPTRRHFIEFFTWLPGQRQTWTLTWRVFEVVRGDMVPVTSARLTTISAERPPPDPPVGIRSMARLRVNDQGDAEWAVLSGPDQRSEVIESDAERQEVTEQARARRAAEARVDWTRRSARQRPPTLTYADANGCANVFVYSGSADRTEAIAIRADKDLLGLSNVPRTLEVASHAGLELLVHVYERPVRSWPFCTDVGVPEASEETWRATRGSVTIELSQTGVRAHAPFAYRATIRIVGAEFVSSTGVRVTQAQPIVLSAIVGGI